MIIMLFFFLFIFGVFKATTPFLRATHGILQDALSWKQKCILGQSR